MPQSQAQPWTSFNLIACPLVGTANNNELLALRLRRMREVFCSLPAMGLKVIARILRPTVYC